MPQVGGVPERTLEREVRAGIEWGAVARRYWFINGLDLGKGGVLITLCCVIWSISPQQQHNGLNKQPTHTLTHTITSKAHSLLAGLGRKCTLTYNHYCTLYTTCSRSTFTNCTNPPYTHTHRCGVDFPHTSTWHCPVNTTFKHSSNAQDGSPFHSLHQSLPLERRSWLFCTFAL